MFIYSPVVASDDSSVDEPLIKMKSSAPAKKSVKRDNTSPRSNGTNKKKAGGYMSTAMVQLCFLIFVWNGWLYIFVVCYCFRYEYR